MQAAAQVAVERAKAERENLFGFAVQDADIDAIKYLGGGISARADGYGCGYLGKLGGEVGGIYAHCRQVG
jgi:hypothetical protein